MSDGMGSQIAAGWRNMSAETRKKTATLKDIAVATGFSINTISRALRDKDDISAATREKIKRVAREMNHATNMLASSLRLGYTNTIAVILGDVSNPHFAIMMKEIEEYARKFGYITFLVNTNEDAEAEFQAIQAAQNKHVDGIILCPTQVDGRNIAYLRETGTPFVLIGRHFPEVETDFVVCNDRLGGYQAVSYLIAMGHRDILMLNGPTFISSARERFEGYRQALKEHGIPFRSRLVKEVPATADGCELVLQEALAQREKSPEHGFTAIFAFSDMIAWTAWTCLEKRGLTIGRDYSLIGFDHIQSRLAIPYQLSTISSYKSHMSTTAVDLLLKRIKGEYSENKFGQVFIDTALVEGETVAHRK